MCLHLYSDSKVVDLNHQSNLLCLVGLVATNRDPSEKVGKYSRFIKQHTEEWQNIRAGACATGSTLHTALGPGTLKKKELEHFDHDVKGKPLSKVPDHVQMYKRYESWNKT